MSWVYLPVTNLADLFLTFSSPSCRCILWGSQTELPYSRTERTSPLCAGSLTSRGHAARARLRKQRILLAFVQIPLTCVFHFRSLVMVMPRYLIFSTFSRTVPSKHKEALIFLIRFLVICIILHLTG